MSILQAQARRRKRLIDGASAANTAVLPALTGGLDLNFH